MSHEDGRGILIDLVQQADVLLTTCSLTLERDTDSTSPTFKPSTRRSSMQEQVPMARKARRQNFRWL